jgi:hypothetical protein
VKLIQHQDPVSLRGEIESLLAQELPQLNSPVPPIQSVSMSTMALGENSVSFRNLFLLPWIVGMFVVLYLQADEIYGAWKAQEQWMVEHLESQEAYYGSGYLLSTNDWLTKKYLSVLDNNKLPFPAYMKMRYDSNWFTFAEDARETDILRTSIASVLIILLTIWAVFMKRKAPLYFDRDKKIIYTWRKGKVWAQRYENLSYHLNVQALIVMLRMINPEGEEKPLWWGRYIIQPTGNPFFNFKSLQINVLAAIVKFMEHGQHSVWPRDWEGRKPFYFFADKRPDDFERQLSLILKKLDSEV